MSAPPPVSALPSRLILGGVAGLGFSAMIAQLVLLRELFAAFSASELVFGIGLGAWLLLTGAGAAAAGACVGRPGKPLPNAHSAQEGAATGASSTGLAAPEDRRLAVGFVLGLIWIALTPLVALVALRLGRDWVFDRGSTVGMPETVLASAVVLAPFCLVSGALLTLACTLLGRSWPGQTLGRVYLADTVGSVVAGVLFSFVLVSRLDSFASLAVSAAVMLVTAGALAWSCPSRMLASLAAVLAVVIGAAVSLGDLEAATAGRQYHAPVIATANSPYGRLVITHEAGQTTVFVNGLPLAENAGVATREEAVHYALAQRPTARRILVISGLASGVAREALAYGADGVTTVELDPRLTAAMRAVQPELVDDLRLTVVHGDARRFVQDTTARFDAIIVNLPDPGVLQLNRYFTVEFFAAAHRALVPGGVLGFGLERYENFVSADLAAILSTAYHTVRTSFAHVRLFPGSRVYFVASDAPLSSDIVLRAPRRPAAQLVRPGYLNAMLTPDRLADLDRAVAGPAEPNRDFVPRLQQLELRRWRQQHGGLGAGAVGLSVMALGVYLFRLGPVTRAVFAAGFSVSTLEVVLLLTMQVWFGSLYQNIGWVVTACMAGLALGAVWAGRPAAVRCSVASLTAGLAVFGLLGAWALPRVGPPGAGMAGAAGGAILLVGSALLLGGLAGAQFARAGATLRGGEPGRAGRLFGADLIGAAAGALLASAWLIPQLGVPLLCALTAALNLAAAGALSRPFARAA